MWQAMITLFFFCALASPVQAQIPGLFSPARPDGDTSDIEEVEDEAGEDDVLPAFSESITGKEAAILEQQMLELGLNHLEIRRGFRYGASLAAGETIPWQNFSLEVFAVGNDADTYGVVVGTGGFHDEGRVDDRHFDLDFTTRSTAVTRRYYSDVLGPVSVLVTAGAIMFEGKIDPSGSDDLLSSEDERLQSTFRATGGFLGLAISLDALWQEGYFLEWTPIGLRYTWLFDQDLSRDSVAAADAVEKKLENLGIFGLVNIKFGMLL